MGITELYSNAYCIGKIRYFKGDRLYNENALYEFNKRKITAKELVTFDSALMNLMEITQDEIDSARGSSEQIIAIIIRPGIEISFELEHNSDFVFCGYDLVESFSGISAITNCGADWGDALDYSILNEFGLIPDYRKAVMTQLDLAEKYPDESHAYCEIIEIWRIIN
ncbi:MAG: hypothetical protein IJ079_09915 [Lachnospiraceae bacterium]|nr:hypothetical protein [Lachnospiraceae bacterium]